MKKYAFGRLFFSALIITLAFVIAFASGSVVLATVDSVSISADVDEQPDILPIEISPVATSSNASGLDVNILNEESSTVFDLLSVNPTTEISEGNKNDKVKGDKVSVYQITINTPAIAGMTVDLTGTASTTNSIGNSSQYDVEIAWGDGSTTATSTHTFEPSMGDFKGIWGTTSHTYAISGMYTIIAKLYHGNLSGNDGSATTSVQVEVTVPESTGSIVVHKDVIGPEGQDIQDTTAFTVTLAANNQSITASSSVSENSDAVFLNLAPGLYSISEDYLHGYTLNSISSSTVEVVVGATSTINIVNKQNSTSTATINVHKVTNPSDFNQPFTFTLSQGTTTIATTTANAAGSDGQFTNLQPGTYNLTEDLISMWSFSDVSCRYDGESEGNSIENGKSITVDEGDVVDCTFTNNATSGAIRVIKNVVASDGSTNVSDTHTFSVTLNGTSTQSISETTDVLYSNLTDNESDYTIEENTDVDYDLVSISPDNSTSTPGAQISLQLGTTTVVTITNKQHAQPTTGGGSTNNSGGGAVAYSSGGSIVPAIGQVLGAATDTPNSCSIFITTYMGIGKKNNSSDVRKLQAFLNKNLGTKLPITGFFGPLTKRAVEQFQIKYAKDILGPWVDAKLHPSLSQPTGYVYKTTLRWINLLECSTLSLPIPPLN